MLDFVNIINLGRNIALVKSISFSRTDLLLQQNLLSIKCRSTGIHLKTACGTGFCGCLSVRDLHGETFMQAVRKSDL
jgi:hypothetical protein